MRPALLEYIRRDGPLHLALMGGGRGRSALAAFRGREAYPVWIAKTATDEGLISRMNREREALEYLAPWAEKLGIPRILHWETLPGLSHLIRSGVPGDADIFALPVTATAAAMDGCFAEPVQWLRLFQQMVPPPRLVTTAELLTEQIDELERTNTADVAGPLAEALRQMAPAAGPATGVVTHGDFFPQNILHASDGLRVVDWDAFGSHMPMRDYIYLFFGAEYFRPGHALYMDEIAAALLFTPRLDCCRYVVGQLEQAGFGPAQLRFYFYCYLAHMLSQHPRERHVWQRFFERARRHDFPVPGTELGPE